MRYSLDRLDLALVTLIALAFAIMALVGAAWDPMLVDGTVLALAAIKGRRILLDYLDLRSAPALWRGLVTTWLMLIAGFAWAVSAVSICFPDDKIQGSHPGSSSCLRRHKERRAGMNRLTRPLNHQSTPTGKDP
jgi:hypothetical protein